MRLHRFIGDFDLSRDIVDVSDSELANQIRNVLRLKPLDVVILSDGNGTEARATILECNKKFIELSIDEVSNPAREPNKSVTLYTALLKGENFELIAQKATELGIAKIVPIITTRTVKTGFNHERVEKIIKEASEQSGRTTVPELGEPIQFLDVMKEINPKESVLFDLSGNKLESMEAKKLRSLFIGPEGGFTDEEVALAKKSGVPIASLGELTLRGETAAIVATYTIIHS